MDAAELAAELGLAGDRPALARIESALADAYEAGQEAGGDPDWRKKARAVRRAYTIIRDGADWLQAHQPGPVETIQYMSTLYARLNEVLAEGGR